MTTIACGGGPNLDERRAFAGLKPGTHVPGYCGYCPQRKYRIGKTYGEETHLLSATSPHTLHSTSIVPVKGKPPLRNVLPHSTGNNKYTDRMVPGYTGYIPRGPFKFGDTYKVDCDYCIDEHLTNRNRYSAQEQDLRRSTKSFPRLQAERGDPTVRDHLNTYRDTHPVQHTLIDNKRSFTEPPMPGYKGFVPRIYTTELGLGCTYHDMTRQGLQAFQNEMQHRQLSQTKPITIDRVPSGPVLESSPHGPYSKRLYVTGGMIPNYAGYVPQIRYNFGNNFGNTTRSLDVCNHQEESFGNSIKTRNLRQSVAY